VFTLCFIGTHIPLIAFLGWLAIAAAPQWGLLTLLLVATLLGSGVTIAGIGALLAPIVMATNTLTKVERREPVTPLEPGGPDLIGQLIEGVNNAAQATERFIQSLDDAASRDPLTGLKNRRGFLERTSPALLRYPHSTVALIDVDHFKAVNDELGHAEGDRVLRAIAKALKGGVRQNDFVARWGGEEFVVLFAGTNITDSVAILERIRLQLVESPAGLLKGKPVTFSAGVASMDLQNRSIESALSRADHALYGAKRAGRDRILAIDDF
jgi:diguanylate cyclase (GGDEF)-like protein